MSDPIALHSKPLSNPLDSIATNQPPATGQFQQLRTQQHEATNQMPAPADEAGKKSHLLERSIRQSDPDAFLSDRENMIKVSKQRNENSLQSLQAHKDRFFSLGFRAPPAEPTSHKPTLASTVETLPEAGIAEPAQSGQAQPDSNAPTVKTTTAAGQHETDSTTETVVSRSVSNTGHQTDGSKDGTIKRIIARVRGTSDEPNTRVTTTEIVTKTVTTTTKETLPDQPTSSTSSPAPKKAPDDSPADREKDTSAAQKKDTSAPQKKDTSAPQKKEQASSHASLPGGGKITPAVEQPRNAAPSASGTNTLRRESASSSESAEFHVASSTIIDPDAEDMPKRTRDVTISYGEKNKYYRKAEMPEGAPLSQLQETIEKEIDDFRKDKRRSKMYVEVASLLDVEEGQKNGPVYVSFTEPSQKRRIKPTHTPSTEVARNLVSRLAEEELRVAKELEAAALKDGKDRHVEDEQRSDQP